MSFNLLAGYQAGAYNHSLTRTLTQSAANTSQSLKHKMSSSSQANDKLLDELASLLNQSTHRDTEAGAVEVIQVGERTINLKAAAIETLFKELGLNKLLVDENAPLTPAQMTEMIKQYLALQKALEQIRSTIAKLQSGDVFSEEQQAWRERFYRLVQRFDQQDWDELPFLAFVDLFETKLKQRREFCGDKLVPVGPPEEELERPSPVDDEASPNIEYVNQILQMLCQQAGIEPGQEDEQALFKAWLLVHAN